MRVSHEHHLTKAEWISTQIGLGIVVAVAMLLEELPKGAWVDAVSIVIGAVATAALCMLAVRTFSRKSLRASVPLNAEVNHHAML